MLSLCYRYLAPALAFVALTASLLAEEPGTEPSRTNPVAAALADIEPPRSEFADAPTGRDPFYPNAKYRKPRKPLPSTTPTDNIEAVLAGLKLNGFGGTDGHRWAMINGYSIYAGEHADVNVAGKTYRIVCVEMKEGSVIVGVKGHSTTRELRIR